MKLNAAQVQALIHAGLPVADQVGLRVERADADGVRVRQPYRDDQLRPGGTLSGPTLMTLADAAMFAAILARLGDVQMAVTQNLNINFLRRPRPADLLADCRILRCGRRTAVLEVTLYSDGEVEPVAHATGTYALP